MDYVLSLPTSSWDDEFKKIAIRNIKANPVKYLRNCMSNVSRLLFGIPFSYFFQQEKTLIRIPPNSIIAVLMFFSMIPTFIYWKRITVALQYLFIISFIYLGLSTLVSAYPRQFYVLVPVLLLWIGYIIENNVIIKAKFLDSLTERIRNLFFSLL